MSLNFRVVILYLLFIGLFSSCKNQGDKKEEIPGKKLYNSLCTSCHGLSGNLKLSGAADLQTSKLSAEEIEVIITNGKGTMPSFKKYLSEDQINNISEYCLSLRK